MKNKPHKLFISHSSKDAEYMKAFVDLLVAIGVHKNQITCTSVPQCNIPVGCNIYDWLAKQFQTSDLHVVYAFSDNYYSSVATLNEMGAAWVMRCKWTGFLLPGFTFNQLAGCIDKNQICIKLDDPDIITLKQRLRQFRDDIIKEFGLESIDEDEWEEKRDDFLDKIKIIAQQKNVKTTPSNPVTSAEKKYLVYYDERWDCKLFLNYKTVDRADEESVINKVSADLNVDKSQINCRYISSKVQEKYSESHQENRIYNHRLYEIKIQVFPEDEQKENFVVNGRHYYWMSISDMERDPNIVKKILLKNRCMHNISAGKMAYAISLRFY